MVHSFSIDQLLESQFHEIDGRCVEVKEIIKKSILKKKYFLPENNLNKIFVGGIPTNINEEDFKEYFQQFGIVTEACIKYSNKKKACQSRGFGFIVFEDSSSMELVLNWSQKHVINGKEIECRRCRNEEEEEEELEYSLDKFKVNNTPINKVCNIVKANTNNLEFNEMNEDLKKVQKLKANIGSSTKLISAVSPFEENYCKSSGSDSNRSNNIYPYGDKRISSICFENIYGVFKPSQILSKRGLFSPY